MEENKGKLMKTARKQIKRKIWEQHKENKEAMGNKMDNIKEVKQEFRQDNK